MNVREYVILMKIHLGNVINKLAKIENFIHDHKSIKWNVRFILKLSTLKFTILLFNRNGSLNARNLFSRN